MSEAEDISIDALRIDGGTQVRESIDDATVDQYNQSIDAGATFPPLDVFYDGTDYWLADGFHRLLAYKRAKYGHVTCNVHKGTKADAAVFACAANKKHGRPMNNEDKAKAVRMMLSLKPEYSDRQIAEWVGVSHNTVKARRAVGQTDQQEKRTGKDGKTYKAKKPAREPITFGDVDEDKHDEAATSDPAGFHERVFKDHPIEVAGYIDVGSAVSAARRLVAELRALRRDGIGIESMNKLKNALGNVAKELSKWD